jgi:hypothetical protein
MSLRSTLFSGKNSNLLYYARNGLRRAEPHRWLRARLPRVLASLEGRPDRDYILSRVDYYNKLTGNTVLPDNSPRLGDFRLKGHKSVYFFDSYEIVRWFDPALHWQYVFGDVIHVPPVPAIVKSRPIAGDNVNSVVLKLEKNRHFTFLDDRIPFREKENRSIFRGHIIDKPHRIRFMEMYHGHPACDAGIISPDPQFPAEWVKPAISLWDHLRYKFILALEGNDVASNLKWIMSSGSLAVMPRPKYETWFMEGTLIPERHYVEIRSDYADLEEKMNHYIARPHEAEAIAARANEYIAQFRDPQRERLISLLVMDKYFRRTGQLPER